MKKRTPPEGSGPRTARGRGDADGVPEGSYLESLTPAPPLMAPGAVLPPRLVVEDFVVSLWALGQWPRCNLTMLVEKAVRVVELEFELSIMSFDEFRRRCCLIWADQIKKRCQLYETAL